MMRAVRWYTSLYRRLRDYQQSPAIVPKPEALDIFIPFAGICAVILLGALGNLVHPLFWIPFVPFACVFVPLWWHILKMPGAGAAG